MKIVGISVLAVLGFMFWRVTERLSSDALGVAIGLTLAGVFCGAFGFMGLLFYMTKRREDRRSHYAESRQLEQRPASPYGHPQQPPVVIVVAGPTHGIGENCTPVYDQRRMIDAAPLPERGSFELLG